MMIHIYAPEPESTFTKIYTCPSEEAQREFYCEVTPYLGIRATCLSCGDEWIDGERTARPFIRNWRMERIQKACDRRAARKQEAT
jgi:hypothetical protein